MDHTHHSEHDHAHGHEHSSTGGEGACCDAPSSSSSTSHSHSHKHGRDEGDGHGHGHSHGHSHEHMESPGKYDARPPAKKRRYTDRAFCVGVGGPVGSGKTAFMLAACKQLRTKYNLCAVTNDIFTREDGEFLVKHAALSEDRIQAVETGGCPHAAIREDITANMLACEELTAKHKCDLILLGGCVVLCCVVLWFRATRDRLS